MITYAQLWAFLRFVGMGICGMLIAYGFGWFDSKPLTGNELIGKTPLIWLIGAL